MILIKNRQKKYPLDTHYIKETVQKLLDTLGYSDFDIGIWFTNNTSIAKYNRIYRHKSGPTDILSFPYHQTIKAGKKIKAKTSDQRNLGDIIISLEFVHTSKRWRDCEPQDTLKILLVHGICHLLGYDHETEEDYQKMHAKEQRLIRILDNKN
jgi:rRNA maturation RNase YbeY